MKFFKTASYIQLGIASSLFFGNLSVAYPSLSLLGFFVFILVVSALVIFAVMNINKISRANYGQIDRQSLTRAFLPSIVLFSAFLILFIIGGAIALL